MSAHLMEAVILWAACRNGYRLHLLMRPLMKEKTAAVYNRRLICLLLGSAWWTRNEEDYDVETNSWLNRRFQETTACSAVNARDNPCKPTAFLCLADMKETINQAVTKDLTSSSKFSGSCVLTLQTIPNLWWKLSSKVRPCRTWTWDLWT